MTIQKSFSIATAMAVVVILYIAFVLEDTIQEKEINVEQYEAYFQCLRDYPNLRQVHEEYYRDEIITRNEYIAFKSRCNQVKLDDKKRKLSEMIR